MRDDSYMSMCGVKTFLEQLGLGRYYDMFRAKGYDSEADLRHIDREALDGMYITDKLDRDLILSYANQYHPNTEFLLYEWLRQHNLEYYYINFIQSGRDTLDIVQRMVLPDEEVYDDLEITLPGHKKRLERAVSQLKDQPSSTKEAEYPVAFGRWIKPKALIYAKYEFLCIDASIFSTKHPDRLEELEFMVDSGSDVVTLRKDIVEKLDLKELGCVRSKGVHISKHKTLYEAKLKIGPVELKIEVISEKYNSLGSRVFRCFRHYISGSRHVWLKGDYDDPTMAIQPSEISSQQAVTEEKNQRTVMKPAESILNNCVLSKDLSTTKETEQKAEETKLQESSEGPLETTNKSGEKQTTEEMSKYSDPSPNVFKTPPNLQKRKLFNYPKPRKQNKSQKRNNKFFSKEEPAMKKALKKLTYN